MSFGREMLTKSFSTAPSLIIGIARCRYLIAILKVQLEIQLSIILLDSPAFDTLIILE